MKISKLRGRVIKKSLGHCSVKLNLKKKSAKTPQSSYFSEYFENEKIYYRTITAKCDNMRSKSLYMPTLKQKLAVEKKREISLMENI